MPETKLWFERWLPHAWNHLAIASSYAILYYVLVQVSDGIWAITAGLRLSFLLLTPKRYWASLFVAEAVPLGFHLQEIARYSGWTAAWLCAVPPIGSGMPIVWFYRQRNRLITQNGDIDACALVACAVILSVVWSLINYAILLLAKSPAAQPAFHVHPDQFLILFVGQYAGILTMLPIVLTVALTYRPLSLRHTVNVLANSYLVRDMAIFLVPAIAMLLVLPQTLPPDISSFFRIVMFAVLAILTVKLGWRATAVGSTGIIATIALIGPTHTTTALMVSQATTCFAITSLLLLGSRRADSRYFLDASNDSHTIQTVLTPRD